MGEQGDVGTANSEVSESTVSVTVPRRDETLRKKLSTGGNVQEGSYNQGGEGGEIMVEVVGSDLFVGGVKGHKMGLGKEGLERRIEGDLGGQVWDNRTNAGVEGPQEMDMMSGERVGHVSETENCNDGRGSSGGQTSVVSVEKADVSASEEMVMVGVDTQGCMQKGVEMFSGGNGDLDGATGELDGGLLDDEVWNPGIESVNGSCQLMAEPRSDHTPLPDEETVLGVEGDTHIERDEASRDGVMETSLPLPAEEQSSVIGAIAKEPDKVASAETLDDPIEAALTMQVERAKEEEIFHADDASQDVVTNGISNDVEGAAAAGFESEFTVGHSKITEVNPVVQNLQPVNGGAEKLPAELRQEDQKLTVDAESKLNNNSCIEREIPNLQTKVVLGNEAPINDIPDSILQNDEPCSEDKKGTCVHLEDSYSVKVEETGGEHGIQLPYPLSSDEHSVLNDQNERMATESSDIGPSDGLSCSNNEDHTQAMKIEQIDTEVPEKDVTEADHSVTADQYVEANKHDVLKQPDEPLSQEIEADLSENLATSTKLAPVDVDSTLSTASFSGEGKLVKSLTEGNVCGSSNDVSRKDAEMCLEVHPYELVNSREPDDWISRIEENTCKTDDKHVVNKHATGTKQDVESDIEVDQFSVKAIGADQHPVEADHLKVYSDKMVPDGFIKLDQSGYLRPPENEGHFSVSDLVWGKVRSHPWWPGQICDPADASEMAVKYFKKDCFLVAYFGDRTFAWNDESVLKPLRSNFSQIEKQSNSETFHSAVRFALDEVSRRVELGLACSCVPDVYGQLEYQILENTGIREESSKQYVKDKSAKATSFEPDKLIAYLSGLAQSPTGRIDRLDLTIARAQLLAFCRFKGYCPPPEFVPSGELVENDADLVDTEVEDDHKVTTYHKRKHNLNDSMQPVKKERSLSALMGDMEYYPDDYDDDDSDGKLQGKPTGRKRKALDSLQGSDKRANYSAAKFCTAPKPSFKIGECIRRVASQLTGSASSKSNSDQPGNNVSQQMSESSQRGSTVVPTQFSSLDEMLLQLQLAAQNPREGHGLSNNAVSFFATFRNSVISGRRPQFVAGRQGSGNKRKSSHAGGVAEEFEFDDINDSYWTDRIVQNYSEEQLLQNVGGINHLVAYDPDRYGKPGRGSRKRYSTGNYEKVGEEFSEFDRKKKESSPAELIMHFAEGSLPSEISCNKIFRRFGTLKEAETEVDYVSRRAKVVFKRGSDAEIAYSSAGTFKIFGAAPVTYQLSYSPSSIVYRPLLPPATDPNFVEAYKPLPPTTYPELVEAYKPSPPATDPNSVKAYKPSPPVSNPHSVEAYDPSSPGTDSNTVEAFEPSPSPHAADPNLAEAYKPSPPATDSNFVEAYEPSSPAADANLVEADEPSLPGTDPNFVASEPPPPPPPPHSVTDQNLVEAHKPPPPEADPNFVEAYEPSVPATDPNLMGAYEPSSPATDSNLMEAS